VDKLFRKTDSAKAEQNKKAVEARIRQTAETGSALLADERFIKYKDQFIEAREDCIKYLSGCTEADPIKFALIAKACLAKIDVLAMLIDIAEVDARRSV